jgi:tetratricopeptide (TPR) repeat protein
MSERERRLTLALSLAVALLVAVVVWGPLLHGPAGSAADPAAAEMNAGLLVEAKEPGVAAEHFRKALQLDPNHYGATFQLARSLDLAGKKEEARPQWEAMIKLADAVKDKSTGDLARAALAAEGPAPPPPEDPALEASMKAGLDALYTRHDAASAVRSFREVLARNPEHYGATYQLAAALQETGSPEARAQWEKTLRMAQKINDTSSAAEATRHITELGGSPGAMPPPGMPPAGMPPPGGMMPPAGMPPAPAPPPPAAPAAQSAELDQAMNAGLEALSRHDAATALAEFHKVLERNPDHLGATYQSAAALEQAGRSSEAKAMWQKAITLAEQFHDEKDAADARARLAHTP